MRTRSNIVCFVVATLMALLCSCGSRKGHVKDRNNQYQVEKQSDKQLSSLEKRLGVDLTKKDNLELYREVNGWLGVPYKYGGNTKKGVDCSGLVAAVYGKVYGKKLYRSSSDIYQKNCRKIKKNKLHEGDLIFFATGKDKRRINHVGIYLKNGKFIHASSSKGVIVSRIDDAYYVRTYVGCGTVN